MVGDSNGYDGILRERNYSVTFYLNLDLQAVDRFFRSFPGAVQKYFEIGCAPPSSL